MEAGAAQVEEQKRAAAVRALDFVRPGMVIGLGTGSTARYFIDALATSVRAGLRIRAELEGQHQRPPVLDDLEDGPERGLGHLDGLLVRAEARDHMPPVIGELPGVPYFAPKAKRVIYLFQSGGPSQLELFDDKPLVRDKHGSELPDSIRMGPR